MSGFDEPPGGMHFEPAHLAPQPVKAPIEAKVIASGGGFGVGFVISDAIVGFLDDLVYTHGPVPDYLSKLVVLVVTGGLTLLAAYKAPHTPRPDLEI